MLKTKFDRTILFLLLLLSRPDLGNTEEPKIAGHLKYQGSIAHYSDGSLGETLDGDNNWGNEFEGRVKLEKLTEYFNFSVDGELLGVTGPRVRVERAIQSFARPSKGSRLLPEDRRRAFDLTTDLQDGETEQISARFDRFYVEHTADTDVFRIGRQAFTWGDGLVFNTLDLFNPFSPVTIDKDYKTGDDMVYLQHLFSGGQDVQLLIVPRRDLDSHNLEEDQSSWAITYRGRISDFDLDYNLLGSRHYGEQIFGLGFSKGLFGAVWRFNLAHTNLASNGNATGIIANVDRSWVVLEKNLYLFLEYYRNGVGVDKERYTLPNTDLLRRIEREEAFTLGRDYVAIGGRAELTPRFNVYLVQILNLHDSSGFSQLKNVHELVQSLFLTWGINVPFGSSGTEYGGIRVNEVDLSRGAEGFVRVSYYF